jgi:hypothetical protein
MRQPRPGITHQRPALWVWAYHPTLRDLMEAGIRVVYMPSSTNYTNRAWIAWARAVVEEGH